jgi:hypothetical protein
MTFQKRLIAFFKRLLFIPQIPDPFASILSFFCTSYTLVDLIHFQVYHLGRGGREMPLQVTRYWRCRYSIRLHVRYRAIARQRFH